MSSPPVFSGTLLVFPSYYISISYPGSQDSDFAHRRCNIRMDRSSSSRRRLCFVNSYNAPTVEPSEERRRRAHVTRANFANRRRRLAAQRSHRQLSAASEGASPASHDSTSASETHTPGSVPRDADCWTCDPLAFPSCPPADFLIQFRKHGRGLAACLRIRGLCVTDKIKFCTSFAQSYSRQEMVSTVHPACSYGLTSTVPSRRWWRLPCPSPPGATQRA